MAEISFWVRADSITANNSTLNPIGTGGAQGFPTTEITFTDGGTGDLILEYNGGLPDPDTQVIIGGVTYNFTFQLIGTLPFGNQQVPDVLEGKQVAVITVTIGNTFRELFFVLDGSGTFALMDAFGAGAIPLTAVDTTPPPTPVCFCAGTEIATPSGARLVENIVAGDFVLNEAGAAKQVFWVGRTRATAEKLRANPDLRPIRIPAGSIAPR